MLQAGSADLELALPHPSHCKRGEWVFGDGTRQQSSTMFARNGTLFILAQVSLVHPAATHSSRPLPSRTQPQPSPSP